MNYAVLKRDELRRDGNAYRFDGHLYGNTGVSFLWLDMPPGDGPRLHKHSYGEIILIEEGSATFTVGSSTVEGEAGHVIVIPPETPHKFTNSGEGRLQQIDIHLSNQILTEWLED